MLAFILFLGIVSQCYGNSYRMGACPRVVALKELDFERFTGDWYVIQRFNPMATCTKISIEKGLEDRYMVNETSRPLGINFGYHQQYLRPRKIKFLRNDTNSIFRLEKNLAHFTLSTFGVIDTDYDDYAVVWGCDPVLFGSIQNVDVLSREPQLEPDTMKTVKEVIEEMSVDVHPLDNVDQSTCHEYSNDEHTPGRNTNNIVAEEP